MSLRALSHASCSAFFFILCLLLVKKINNFCESLSLVFIASNELKSLQLYVYIPVPPVTSKSIAPSAEL